MDIKELPIFKYNTNFSNRNRRGQIHIDLSKSPKKYMIRDALFALDQLPPIKWIVDTSSSALVASGIFFGDPNTKRTYCSMLSLAICVDLGNALLDFETKRRSYLPLPEPKKQQESDDEIDIKVYIIEM